jgi:hypothetical protein
LAWIFFKAKSISIAFDYIERIFTNRTFASQFLENERYSSEMMLMIIVFVIAEWNSRYKIEPISGKYNWLKLTLCLLAIITLGTYADYKEFIYFQF